MTTTLYARSERDGILAKPPRNSANDAYIRLSQACGHSDVLWTWVFRRCGGLRPTDSGLKQLRDASELFNEWWHRSGRNQDERERHMFTLDIPGFGRLALNHLVLDYNGTLAVDGHVLEGVHEEVDALSNIIKIHVVTGNSHGDAQMRLAGWNVTLTCLPAAGQARAKKDYLEELGARQCAAIGNGRNDVLMLKAAALGIAVLGSEGLATDAANSADVQVRHPIDALGLFLHPTRLLASLRS